MNDRENNDKITDLTATSAPAAAAYVTRYGRTTTTTMTDKPKTTFTLTEDQFERLLSKMAPTASTTAPPTRGSFTTCNYSYNGHKSTEVVEAFLAAVNIFKRREMLSDSIALDEIALLLRDEAGIWWQGVKKEVTSWINFEKRLRESFAPVKEPYLIYLDITQVKQESGVSTETFVRQKRMLFSQLPEPGHQEEQQLDIVYGLLNIEIRDKVPRRSIKDFDQLLKAARSVEHVLQEKVSEKAAEGPVPVSRPDGRVVKQKCRYCKNLGHLAENCRKRQYAIERMSSKEPMKSKHSELTEAYTQAPSPSTPKFSCYGCGTPGVVRTNCPTCHKGKKQSLTQREVEFCAVDTSTDARDRPVVFIDVDGIATTAYLDTCAKTSIASYDLYCNLKRKGYLFKEVTIGVTLADGKKKRQNVLVTRTPIKFHNRTILTTLLVLPDSSDSRTLLGVGFIQDAHIVLNLPQNTYSFVDDPSEEFELYTEGFVNFTNKATPPIRVKAIPSPNLPENSQTETGFMRPYKPLIPIDVSTPPHKKAYTKLFDGYSPVMDALYEDAKNVLQDYDDDMSAFDSMLFPDTDIASIDVEDIEGFLERNADVFKPNGKPVIGVEHVSDTGSHNPISVPPYRLSPMKTEVLKKEINKMLHEGVIEPSSSPWSAPVVMVPKKDGGIRVCVDYRQLNSITVSDAYPLPRIDDLLHNAKPTPYMSTIDLRAGYWQIMVKEADQSKTAFVTPFGMYSFKRMPFGLRNAPATFQRMMDRFRITLSHIKLLIYLDDLIVLSPTYKNHLQDLQDVFNQLRVVNLIANRDKCNFCCSKIKYLGHYITSKGLEVDPDKVSTIMKMAPPRNLKHLMSFIQMCSWYRRFMPKFAEIAEPLTRLTRKNHVWKWEEEQKTAFLKLRDLLASPPVLMQADDSKPYLLKTDASNYAIGAVLVQGEGENEHPIEYASRLLTQAERNYSTTEREALAVVWAVNKFRGYIEGAKITVLTDHQALRWLMSLKSPTGRLARWALQLQPYDITIKYITGRTNVVADSLSRPSCDPETEEDCGLCTIAIDMPKKSETEIRVEQLKDEKIMKIVECLESASEEKAQYWSKKGYVMNNGLLYRYIPDSSFDNAQLVVPKQEQEKVIKTYHDEALAGHYGVEKTIERISQRYCWSGMRGQIESYVRKCLKCQRYKPSNQKPAGLLQTTASSQRFEVVAFDLFGPLPRTPSNHNWIFIVEDLASRWIELFALQHATAEECAKVLLNEIILRYGTPRRFISDNGTQFVSSVLQQLTFCLNIEHGFTPVYHPETNPVERRNRDLKTQLAILVEDDHTSWFDKLPGIRFAMNTAKSCSTGFTPAFLTYGRELRTPDDVQHDFREIVQSENFVTEITPSLLLIAETLKRAKEIQEMKEERRKEYVDKKRQACPIYRPGDYVLVDSHTLSKSSQGYSSKLAPRRDGPYVIKRQHGPSSFEIAHIKNNDSAGLYHASALRRYHEVEGTELPTPAMPLRKRGRPRKPTCDEKHMVTRTIKPRGRPPKNKR